MKQPTQIRDWEMDTVEVLQLLYSELSEDWRYRDGHLWNTPTLMLAMMGSFATVLLDVDKLPAWISVFVSTVITLVIFLILLKNVRDRHFANGSAHLLGEIERIMGIYLRQTEHLKDLVRTMDDMKGKGGALRKVEPLNNDSGGILTRNYFFRRISKISSTGILLRLNILILIVSAANTVYLVVSNMGLVAAPAVTRLITWLSPISVVLIPLLVYVSVVGFSVSRLSGFRKRREAKSKKMVG